MKHEENIKQAWKDYETKPLVLGCKKNFTSDLDFMIKHAFLDGINTGIDLANKIHRGEYDNA